MAGQHCFVVIAILFGICPTAVADPDQSDLASALTTAASAGVERGDPQAAGTLRLLADLPAPWTQSVLSALESSTLLSSWGSIDPSAREALAGPLAALQGEATRSSAGNITNDPIAIAFTDADPRWLRADFGSSGHRDLLLSSTVCSPDVVAFRTGDRLPARPVSEAIYLSETLLVVSTDGPTDIRVRQGDCEDSVETVITAVELPPRKTLPTSYGAVTNRFPAISTDQLYTVSLQHRTAETFSMPTERGFVYEVYGAPIASEVDVSLLRADPQSVAGFAAASNDNGVLTAHLTPIVGTGNSERFVVARRIAAAGEVALFAQRKAVPESTFEHRIAVPLGRAESKWLRMQIPAGKWTLTTTHLSRYFDPALTVYDGSSGRMLAENDDYVDGDRSARVLLDIPSSQEIYIRVDSLDDEGRCTIEFRPTNTKRSPARGDTTAPPSSPT